MFSNFICAHPRCPKDPDVPAVRYAIKEFMEAQAPSNFFKERWAASYDPARKVTYVSWFLGTVAYFLDKLDFSTLAPPPVETKVPVFISEPPSAPLDPAPPPCNQAPVTSPSSAASRNPGQPIALAAPAGKPARQSRRWNAGGPAGLAALEARNAAACATHPGKLRRHWLDRSSRQTASSRSAKRPPEVDDPSNWESGMELNPLVKKNDETAEHVVRSDGTAHRGAGQLG
jgi:hypothetical protein